MRSDDAPAVHRLERQGLEDEQVQRALQQVGRFSHEVGPYISTIESKATLLSIVKRSWAANDRYTQGMGIPDWVKRARSGWPYDGRVRPPFAVEPGPGQESVWDYPRPPRLAASRAR